MWIRTKEKNTIKRGLTLKNLKKKLFDMISKQILKKKKNFK